MFGFGRPRTVAALLATAGLLVTAGSASQAAGTTPARAGAGTPVSDCLRAPVSCYGPRQFQVAYGLPRLLDHGIDGRGETVLVPEVAAQPPGSTSIRRDLAVFDRLFGLPAAKLRIINTLAHSATPGLAEGEEVEDAEIVHAVAPGATIDVVLVRRHAVSSPAAFTAALTTVLRLTPSLGSVISISASLGEHFFGPAAAAEVNAALRTDRARGVTVVASTGDYGASSDENFGSHPVKEVSLPASDPLVLAVGGTSLKANRATGGYIRETAWNTLPLELGGHSSASAGGYSHLFARPGYQDGVRRIAAARGVPDVAADASFNTGMALAFALGHGRYAISGATGTSAATPLWGALIALADQAAGRHLGFVNPAIYAVASGPFYHAAFHDITTGNNTFKAGHRVITGYQASAGWDPVTGWGSPDAQVLVPLLASAPAPARPAAP